MELQHKGGDRWAVALPEHLRYTRHAVAGFAGVSIPTFKKWAESRLIAFDATAEGVPRLGGSWRRYSAADVVRAALMGEIVRMGFGWEAAAFAVNHICTPWIVEGVRRLPLWMTSGAPAFAAIFRSPGQGDEGELVEVKLPPSAASLNDAFVSAVGGRPRAVLVIDVAAVVYMVELMLEAAEIATDGDPNRGGDADE